MGLDYFASSSPVIAMFPQPHYFENGPSSLTEQPQFRKFAPKFPSPPPSINYLSRSSNNIAGRKRSRCDLGEDHEAEFESSGPVQAPQPSRGSPILGPGMTLIYPDEPPLNIAAESQSGTWLEQQNSAEVTAASAAADMVDRPRLPARKSSRRVSVDENLESAIPSELDPITLRLGIGWKRLDQAQVHSVAGEETYIKNQYPYVNAPKIVLHHEGLAIYVVRSDPIDLRGLLFQWFLFTEDLKSCRLLCNSNEDDVLRRLANKRQDERGNWIPDILADGQIIHAKDAIRPLTLQHPQLSEVMEIDA